MATGGLQVFLACIKKLLVGRVARALYTHNHDDPRKVVFLSKHQPYLQKCYFYEMASYTFPTNLYSNVQLETLYKDTKLNPLS